MEGSCEHGDEPSGSLKLLGVSRVAARLAALHQYAVLSGVPANKMKLYEVWNSMLLVVIFLLRTVRNGQTERKLPCKQCHGDADCKGSRSSPQCCHTRHIALVSLGDVTWPRRYYTLWRHCNNFVGQLTLWFSEKLNSGNMLFCLNSLSQKYI
jgi:hypothetical protein